jgi:hypothetical protein
LAPSLGVSGKPGYYDGHIDRTLRKMRDAAESHVHVLENDSLIVNGIRILGTAAWTEFFLNGRPGSLEQDGLAVDERLQLHPG